LMIPGKRLKPPLQRCGDRGGEVKERQENRGGRIRFLCPFSFVLIYLAGAVNSLKLIRRRSFQRRRIWRKGQRNG
jgi:hypothetical protein